MLSATRLAHWTALCAFLEDQPYNAAYDPHLAGCPHAYLFCRLPAGDFPPAPAERAARRQVVAERRRLRLVYWQTGYGWRLRKNYRATLAELRAAAERQAQLLEGRAIDG